MNSFDRAESDYLNSYKDMKDKRDEAFTLRVHEIHKELMSDPSAINDAVQNGCGENPMFGTQLFARKNKIFETHELIWEYINKYNLDEAERLAERE